MMKVGKIVGWGIILLSLVLIGGYATVEDNLELVILSVVGIISFVFGLIVGIATHEETIERNKKRFQFWWRKRKEEAKEKLPSSR